MKAKVYAAGTILNALALGVGSAFGLELEMKVKIDVGEKTSVIVNKREVESVVAKRILSIFGVEAHIEVESKIPPRSGLGSSSAFVNALLCALLKEMGEELNAYRILTANARLSLETGISYTGAFDDAAASLLGGFVVSDNRKLKLYRWDKLKGYAVVLIPGFNRGKVDIRKIREDSDKLRAVLPDLFAGEYCSVMKANSEYYCEKIGYPSDIVKKVWEKVCAGLSGNGPCYVAFGTKKNIAEVKKAWEEYGKVIQTKIAEKPAENVVVDKTLFIKT